MFILFIGRRIFDWALRELIKQRPKINTISILIWITIISRMAYDYDYNINDQGMYHTVGKWTRVPVKGDRNIILNDIVLASNRFESLRVISSEL